MKRNKFDIEKHDKVKVKFLIDKAEDGEETGNVFAFFPEEKFSNWSGGTFMSYAHVGQHSPCHIEYANECKDATIKEYTDLLNELKAQGYKNIEVLNQLQTIH